MTYMVRIDADLAFVAEDGFQAIAMAAAYCRIGSNATIWNGGEIVADVFREPSKWTWTIIGDSFLWEARGHLPSGHVHTDGSGGAR